MLSKTIGKFFSNPRITELAAQRDELSTELRRLESDTDYQAWVRGERVKRQVEMQRDKIKLLDLDIEHERRNTQPPMDPRIITALRWCDQEKIRTSRELRTTGAIKRTIFGGAKGVLLTNSKKINARIEALGRAISEFEKLKDSPAEDLDMAITKIQTSVPILDVATETIECTAGMAATLQP